MSGTKSADTTLATLQQALAPKSGMRRIPLSLETYQHPSKPLSSKLLRNMYAEQEPADARTAAALRSTPGLSQFLAAGTGPIYAINDELPGVIFFVSGTHFYMMSASGSRRSSVVAPTDVWTATDLGVIGTPSGGFGDSDTLFYTIAVGPTAAVVCVPPNAYVSAGPGAPVAQIVTGWPSYGASSVTYLDGYFVFTGLNDPHTFFITQLLDPTLVDPLDFAALDAFPNAMGKVMTLGMDLWFAGASGWEIWYDAGNVDFPFRRRPNGLIQRPVGSFKSVAKGDERLFWWGADNITYRTVGYQEERISTHAMEALTLPTINSAYVYNQGGHIFYVVNYPDQTAIYDANTKVWHSAASTADGSGPWRGMCCTGATGVPLIGDSGAGRILVADTSLSTDMGVAVKRQVVLPPLYTGGMARAFCARLEVEMDVGGTNSPGDIVLDWSDDGGKTFPGGPRTMNAGATTETRKRVYTTRLGSFRNRVFRLTAQHAMTVYAIDCDITAGAW